MRNVVKGFEFSQMAVPKIHAGKINASYTSFHTASAPKAPTRTYLRSAPKSPLRTAQRPGKNIGMMRGGKI